MKYIGLLLFLVACAKGGGGSGGSGTPACSGSKFIQNDTTSGATTIYDANCIYSYVSGTCSQSGSYQDTGIGQTSGKVYIKLNTDTCGSNAGKTTTCNYTLDSQSKPVVFGCSTS